jgi:hypothetical protein
MRLRPQRFVIASVCLLLMAGIAPSVGRYSPGESAAFAQGAQAELVAITVHTDHPVNTFRPSEAFGAGVDGHERDSIARMYTPANLKAMAGAGFKSLTYRLRTELAVEAWHWNPAGTWSDADGHQGYWTSSATPTAPILQCNGYRLPRRGNSIDQANNAGYSRLTDGDPRSFWKSNPYLDPHFTHEPEAAHPQWVVLDLRRTGPVNAVRLLWGTPYAVSYALEYFTGPDPMALDEEEPPGRDGSHWAAFPQGIVREGRGGDVTIRFADRPRTVRFLRIVMTAGSHTAPPHATDIRDSLGYALREVEVGTTVGGRRFTDLLKHGKTAATQTLTYTSSTDPWHSEADKDPDIEQPGFDLVFRSALTGGRPVMVPVAPLYDTPENAVAEIRYLKARGYRVTQVEMGEEPDGQHIAPEDYAALYTQFAVALHNVDPALQLGGPGFQTNAIDYVTWPDEAGNNSWYARFLAALRRRGHLSDLKFFSFEWYPFDDVCLPTAPQLAAAPEMLAQILKRLRRSGLDPAIPWVISEYGYSSFAGAPEADLAGAILNAEIVAQFLTLGGRAAYFYGYEPVELLRETTGCNSWGNLALFQADERGNILRPLAAYYGARLVTQEWTVPGEGRHTLFAADCALKNPRGQPLITAYAVHRPDKQWAILLLNKDPKRAYAVHVQFRSKADRTPKDLSGTVTEIQYSSRQYVWHPAGKDGYAAPNLPPKEQRHAARGTDAVTLAPYSITVLRGQGPDEHFSQDLPVR